MIFKAIWLLLQICFTVYETLRRLCWRSQLIFSRYETSPCAEDIYLDKCRTELTKLPHHLSIIIGPEELSLKDELISRLITYSLQMNIDCISFYDVRLKKNRRLSLSKLEPPKYIQTTKIGEKHMLWTMQKNQISCNSNGFINGYTNSVNKTHSIQIYNIEPFQGHSLISGVCQDLFEQRQHNEIQQLLQNRTLLLHRLDDELSQCLGKSRDPELCIIFSKYLCTFGMLPWQMRFTEFHIHQQGNLFNARHFTKILFQYARCEQRWGK